MTPRSAVSAGGPWHSAIYRGSVRHRRLGVKGHEFSYRVFMVYLDLAELPDVFRGTLLWSSTLPALAWFRRRDYLAGAEALDTAVRDRVQQELGERPEGPIRMLTNLRYFGYLQNPISCYYCFDHSGQRLHSMVLEVTNTPWGQRVSYVLRCDPSVVTQRIDFDKTLHVSPFMPMDMQYRWDGNVPGEHLAINLENRIRGDKVFDATLALQRQAISPTTLRVTLLRYPFMTAKVAFGIYWQAAKLFLIKRIKFHANPHTT